MVMLYCVCVSPFWSWLLALCWKPFHDNQLINFCILCLSLIDDTVATICGMYKLWQLSNSMKQIFFFLEQDTMRGLPITRIQSGQCIMFVNMTSTNSCKLRSRLIFFFRMIGLFASLIMGTQRNLFIANHISRRRYFWVC